MIDALATNIPDARICASGWGVRPVLFAIRRWPVHSYAFFIVLAVLVGLLLFWRETIRQGARNEGIFYVLLAALFGGVLGSKVAIAIVYWRELAAHWPDVEILTSGRSIVGGLVGGGSGVFFAKRWLGLTVRTGNLFVPGVAAGVALGRMGCFLRGCCYGTPTDLPWGVDFGDGILRHPTQVYESLFMAIVLGFGLVAVRRLPKPPGMVFKLLMIVYFSFRFVIEFIRVESTFWLGLSLFQWMSAGVVVFYGIDLARLIGKERRALT